MSLTRRRFLSATTSVAAAQLIGMNQAQAAGTPGLKIELQKVHGGYDRKRCWVHCRAGIIPSKAGKPFSAVMTMHELLLSRSDVYFPIHDMRSDNGGKTWTKHPGTQPGFARRDAGDGIEEGISDFWPTWHAASGVLLGTGHTVRYKGDHLQDHPRPRDTVYSTYDPKTGRWAAFQALQTPDEEFFFMDGAGSTQRVDLPNGELLLPTYSQVRKTASGRFNSTSIASVMRCSFDGTTLKYIERGNELFLPNARGFSEPSLVHFGNRYLMTLRNDAKNYLTVGKDGLNFGTPQPLKFDNGQELGSYNTQTHWMKLAGKLYLVYTRRGANNDHVFRHRAPLFLAEFDAEKLHVIRETEQVAVPERGARLGNFGITHINDQEAWITVSEWMQSIRPHAHDPLQCEKHGSNNNIFLARIRPS